MAFRQKRHSHNGTRMWCRGCHVGAVVQLGTPGARSDTQGAAGVPVAGVEYGYILKQRQHNYNYTL